MALIDTYRGNVARIRENIARNIPTWGIYYCLVVSRRGRLDEEANRMRGQSQHETPGLKIITYDRLVDNVRLLCNGF